MKNPFLPKLAVVEAIEEETRNIRTLIVSLKSKESIHGVPGQFIEVTIFGYGEFPVSIAGVDGATKKRIRITIKQSGRVTSQVATLSIGSIIGVRGPFGNGFPLNQMKGKNIFMVTGGVGLAAVKYLIDKLIEERSRYGKMILLHGASSQDDLIYKGTDLFDREVAQKIGIEIFLAVENPDASWKGHVGVVTDFIDDIQIEPAETVAVLCGPSIMMKVASEKLAHMGFNEKQVLMSLERRMQCGMGMCGHCMIGQKRVCLDGPVFSLDSISTSFELLF
ncbi:oxidoreductase [Candidatus Woesearchaeota archaeon]|nr:MAG: oxidoreductase [Candidatus Woesearchaeota archaeon]